MGQPNQQPGQPWQQFTVLDGLLLQASYAIAFSVVFLPARKRFLEAIDIGSVVLVLIAACLAAVSGPIVLGSQ